MTRSLHASASPRHATVLSTAGNSETRWFIQAPSLAPQTDAAPDARGQGRDRGRRRLRGAARTPFPLRFQPADCGPTTHFFVCLSALVCGIVSQDSLEEAMRRGQEDPPSPRVPQRLFPDARGLCVFEGKEAGCAFCLRLLGRKVPASGFTSPALWTNLSLNEPCVYPSKSSDALHLSKPPAGHVLGSFGARLASGVGAW